MSAELEALDVALRMAKQPVTIRETRRSQLPNGVSHVLELAIGDPKALKTAAEHKKLTDQQLRQAAEFFVEQVLFYHRANSYRVFGVEPDASNHEIRHHMALVMKWLHPDISVSSADEAPVDRSIFINRATEAWEDLKSEKRRQEYDETLRASETPIRRRRNMRSYQGQRQGTLRHAIANPDDRSPRRVQTPSIRRPILRRLVDFLIRRS
jgi:DnaJ domain